MKHLPILLLSGICLVATTGCIKAPFDSLETGSFDQMNVSSNFDWKTSRDVHFNITADLSTLVTIVSEDGETLYHQGFYNQLPDPYKVTVNLPTYVKKVLVNGILTTISDQVTVAILNANTQQTSKLRSAKAFPTTGLIAALRLDENKSNTTSESINSLDGTITGGSWVNGISGSAVSLSGSGSNISLPTSENLNPVSDQIGFSLWFKLPEVGANGSFLFQNTKYNLRIDPQGRVSFAVYTPEWKSIVMSFSDRILDTDWHHVVANYNGSLMTIYVDGVLKASGENTGNLKSTKANVLIGSKNSSDVYKGILDEILIYGRPLTLPEIEQIKKTTPNTGDGLANLISSWDLNENTGTKANDSKGGNSGTINNATWTTGIKGSCLNFNGTNSYISVPNATNLNPTNAMTMMAWVKTKENKSAKILEKGDWDGHGLAIDKWLGWQVGIRTEDNISNNLNWGAGTPVLNTWYHLALTYDGSVMKIYVNGQLKNSKVVTGKLKVNGRNLCIGSNDGAQKFFNGSIDEVKVFGEALDQTEIQTHFNDQVVSTDKDGDGIADMNDRYPDDPARAFTNNYPATGFGSLAFEDLWPSKGDYDFNDLVVDYGFTIATDANNKVTEVMAKFVIKAIGAGFANGFGFQLPASKLKSSDILVEGSKLYEDMIKLNDNGTEANQGKITIIAFDNANNAASVPVGRFYNVQSDSTYIIPDTVFINMGFSPGIYTIDDLELNTFNPFMIINKTRGMEVHLPNYEPTSLANKALLGTLDDRSNTQSGTYYKTANNLPWAINIASSYDYTIEKIMISEGHLKFIEWAESSGLSFPDWYLDKPGYRNSSCIFKKK